MELFWVPAGIGIETTTSAKVCVYEYFSRSAPLPEFGVSPLSSEFLGLGFSGASAASVMAASYFLMDEVEAMAVSSSFKRLLAVS